MTYYALAALINFVTCSIITIFVFRKDPKNKINLTFALFAFLSALWSLAYFFWQISTTADTALFWCRALMGAAIFISVAYLHFVLKLTGLYEEKKRMLWLSYIMFFLFFVSDFTPYFISRVEPALFFKFWPKPGIFFHPFLALWFLYALYAGYLLYRKYSTSKGIIHSQIQYVFIGMLVGFIGGSTNYFLFYNIPIPPIGNILASVYVAILAYAIIRYRLMDIRVMGRRAFMYIGIGVFSYLFFYGLAWFNIRFFGGIFNRTSYTAGILIAPFFVFVLYRIINGLERLADRYLFANLYTYQETITKLSEELSHSTDINVITDSIVNTLQKLGISRVAIIKIDNRDGLVCKFEKISGLKSHELDKLSNCNIFVSYLIKHQKPLVKEELKALQSSNGEIELIDYMDDVRLALCLPLFTGERLAGVIALGDKNSGDAYNNEDLELLSTLSYQAGIALENARLYKEVQDFNVTLKQKVDEQTKDIQEKAERLEKLLKVKSEFIYLMSHQLRTPISVITGMTSMMKDGDLDGMPTEKRQEFIDGIYTKSRKLADILNDFIKAESMDGEEFKFAPEDIKKTQFEDVVKTVCDSSVFQVKEKGISLEYIPPVSPLPAITTDPHYLEQAITNIVDNAIKYTQKGFVKVKAYTENGCVVCEVSDSGIGIPEADKGRLFDKFVRAKNAVDAYAYGTGLGLFIVKKIVEAHKGGKVTFTSEQNRGTTFKISIPIN